MQKSLNIDVLKCTGCLQCELACSYENTGSFNPSRSYIKVFTFHHEGITTEREFDHPTTHSLVSEFKSSFLKWTFVLH